MFTRPGFCFGTLIAMLGLILLPVANATADELTRLSRSISFHNTEELSAVERETLLDLADSDYATALQTTGARMATLPKALRIVELGHPGDDTYVYDASTELISDLDADGFYHRFSIAVDADTVYSHDHVYAKLYLSYEGGPWNRYAISDEYKINRDSTRDIFTIETELADGFRTGYYDVRISLYDAVDDYWLMDYGPYQDGSLANLPLEDSSRDTYYDAEGYPIETEVVVAMGSMGVGSLLLPLVLLLRLKRNSSKRD